MIHSEEKGMKAKNTVEMIFKIVLKVLFDLSSRSGS